MAGSTIQAPWDVDPTLWNSSAADQVYGAYQKGVYARGQELSNQAQQQRLQAAQKQQAMIDALSTLFKNNPGLSVQDPQVRDILGASGDIDALSKLDTLQGQADDRKQKADDRARTQSERDALSSAFGDNPSSSLGDVLPLLAKVAGQSGDPDLSLKVAQLQETAAQRSAELARQATGDQRSDLMAAMTAGQFNPELGKQLYDHFGLGDKFGALPDNMTFQKPQRTSNRAGRYYMMPDGTMVSDNGDNATLDSILQAGGKPYSQMAAMLGGSQPPADSGSGGGGVLGAISNFFNSQDPAAPAPSPSAAPPPGMIPRAAPPSIDPSQLSPGAQADFNTMLNAQRGTIPMTGPSSPEPGQIGIMRRRQGSGLGM